MNRRKFLTTGIATACLTACNKNTNRSAPTSPSPQKELSPTKEPSFDISLAQWSLNRMLFKGKLDTLDFPKFTKENFDLNAVEYVNIFFKDKAKDKKYLTELKLRSDDQGVRNVLIMCDQEGYVGAIEEKQRNVTLEKHKKWIDAAKHLGCHSIRVNAYSPNKNPSEAASLVADGLTKLSNFAKTMDINVIVENHGGLSSNGSWLANVLKQVNLSNCGSLPDFGNFYEYDRYQGITELMPFAKGVSAKSHEFDDKGDETKTDFYKAMKIIAASNFNGHVGIEYEGKKHSEIEGIKLTKSLLQKIQKGYGS